VKKICYIATIPAVVNSFLRPHIQAASDKYEVTVVCNSIDKHLLYGLKARIIFLPIERQPSPLKDVQILFTLIKLFSREKFDIVHSHMPKTGFVAMLAAWFVGVPRRINTFHGEVWATKHGWKRYALKSFDRLISIFATDILSVSKSQRDFLVCEGIVPLGKIQLIGSGSVCGVDTGRFKPDEFLRRSVRKELGISSSAKIIIFMGRLSHDKGILMLADIFCKIASQVSEVELLVVGNEEDIKFSQVKFSSKSAAERVHYVKFTNQAERYMAAADILCLPSRREGFGMVIIEAAACCVPAVASRIYGITDAVDHEMTGLLFEVDDGNDMQGALLRLLLDNDLRKEMGIRARKRVVSIFSEKIITADLIKFYEVSV